MDGQQPNRLTANGDVMNMNNTLDVNDYDNSLSPTPNRQIMTNSNKRQMTTKTMVAKGAPTQSFNS